MCIEVWSMCTRVCVLRHVYWGMKYVHWGMCIEACVSRYGVCVLGHVYWGMCIEVWSMCIEVCVLRHVNWSMRLGICVLRYVYWGMCYWGLEYVYWGMEYVHWGMYVLDVWRVIVSSFEGSRDVSGSLVHNHSRSASCIRIATFRGNLSLPQEDLLVMWK